MAPSARSAADGHFAGPAKPEHQLVRLSPALVVEDNFLAAIDLTQWLRDWSIETRTSSRVEAARCLAREMRPRLALIDVNLESGFEGLPLARELQVLYGTKIVYITGYTLHDLKDRLIGGDQVAVLFKPIDPEILAAILGKLSTALGTTH